MARITKNITESRKKNFNVLKRNKVIRFTKCIQMGKNKKKGSVKRHAKELCNSYYFTSVFARAIVLTDNAIPQIEIEFVCSCE